MEPAKEKRRHQRQQVLLPLSVTEEAQGRLLFRGSTCNVSAGGVYFRTPNWQDLKPGMAVRVVIEIPPEMFQLLPFGGLRGTGRVVRVEENALSPDKTSVEEDASTRQGGVAICMTSRLRFDPELHLPSLETDRPM